MEVAKKESGKEASLEGEALLSIGEATSRKKDLPQEGWCTWAPIPFILNRSLQTTLWLWGKAAGFVSDCTVVCRHAVPGHTCLAIARPEQHQGSRRVVIARRHKVGSGTW